VPSSQLSDSAYFEVMLMYLGTDFMRKKKERKPHLRINPLINKMQMNAARKQKPVVEQIDPSVDKKFLKKRMVMVVGYNGSKFKGTQKTKGVRTVDEELEIALDKTEMIHHRNKGDLSKIHFNRATRTDKKVHALQNIFSAKLLIDRTKSLKELCKEINKNLPEDLRLFTFR
jgi:hypothetical protein